MRMRACVSSNGFTCPSSVRWLASASGFSLVLLAVGCRRTFLFSFLMVLSCCWWRRESCLFRRFHDDDVLHVGCARHRYDGLELFQFLALHGTTFS